MTFAEAMARLEQAGPELVTELTPANAKMAQEKFLADETKVKPDFVYDDATNYAEGARKVVKLLRQFEQEDFSEMQMEVLRESAEQLRKKYAMLIKIWSYRRKAEDRSVNLILQYSIDLFGRPDEQVYRSLWAERLKKLTKRLMQCEQQGALRLSDAKRLARLECALPLKLSAQAEVFMPQESTVQKFRDFCWQRWRKTLERIDLEKVYTPEEVCELLNTIFREDFPYPVKWEAVIAEKKTDLNANQIERQFEIPRYRAKGPYTGKVILSIIVGHELRVHVARREYAEAYYPDLAVPLPDYLEFEEGLAKAVEQALGDGFERNGIDHYLTAGMAFYDHLSFREIFEIQRDQLFLQDIEPNDTPELRAQKKQKAVNEAYRLTFRCLRGTGVVPLTNNLVYYNGTMRAWQYIEERIDQPEKLEKMLFYSGKTDPTDALHQKMLLSLGWTEADF